MNFIVETSARHLHVTKEDVETLFGSGFTLSNRKALSQPGQFATNEKVTVIGPKGEISMSVLGPCRNATQVEVSFSDARTLGLTPPVRESGDIEGSCPCTLKGPLGEVSISKGVIVAKRHLHTTPDEAKQLNVSDKDIIAVKIETAGRKAIYGDVVVRVSKNFATAMHIDTDEANAAGCSGEIYGEIVKF